MVPVVIRINLQDTFNLLHVIHYVIEFQGDFIGLY